MANDTAFGAAVDLSQIPAGAPPPGVTPDFDSADNYKHRNIVLHSIVVAFTTIAVLVRLYTRAIVKKKFGVDDCEYGAVQHMEDLPC
jgi:hypothetical protein